MNMANFYWPTASLGVVPPSLGLKGGSSGKLQTEEGSKTILPVDESSAEKTRKVLKEVGEAIWVQLDKKVVLSRITSLKCCLVGRWGELGGPSPGFDSTKKLGCHELAVERRSVFVFAWGLVLLDFEDPSEAVSVLNRGLRRFGKKLLFLNWWDPHLGFFRSGFHAKEVWVRLLGRLLHLWSLELFKMLGDRCRGG